MSALCHGQAKDVGPKGVGEESLRFRPDQDTLPQGLGGALSPKGKGRERSSRTSSISGGVEYGCTGAKIFDVIGEIVHMYDEAYIRYEEMEITADYIAYNFGTNEVMAKYEGKGADAKPTFKTGEQVVKADSIRYNIDSEQGLVYGARIKQDQFYIHGAVTKFVRAGQDSLHIDDVVYNRNALLTTCDHEHPHWGIRTTKLKMIPDKLAVVGPFDMELAGIPTPLAMPFAFAPFINFQQKTSGLIFPQDPFISNPDLGIGFRGLGYYFALSDRQDLTLTTDLYTRGSLALNASMNYKKRYKYNGSIRIGYSRQLQDQADQLSPNVSSAWIIGINHRQDAKAHPYRTFGGTLNFTLNDFNRRNYSDVNSQLNGTTNSNFSYAYRFHKNVNFSIGLQHTQNLNNRNFDFTLPVIKLNVSASQPFKKKNSAPKDEKWYEKITVGYRAEMLNKANTFDSLLFTNDLWDRLRNGISQDLSISTSYKLLDYVSFNTSINYDESWYFQTIEAVSADSLGRIDEYDVKSDFETLRSFTVSSSLNTNLFSTIQFKKGWLRGLRHQMTPIVGLSYNPSTEDKYQYFDSPLTAEMDSIRYNPFTSQRSLATNMQEYLVFNNGLRQGGMSVDIRLNNSIQAKRWSKRDSTTKKFDLLSSLNFSTRYNLQADSLNWQPISMTAGAKFFNGKSILSVNGTLDPYMKVNGRRINQTVLATEGKLLRWESLRASIVTKFSLDDIIKLFKGEEDKGDGITSSDIGYQSRGSQESKSELDSQTSIYSWFKSIKFDHTYSLQYVPDNGNPSTATGFQTSAHSLRMTTGQIPLSSKWSMSVSNLQYNFKQGRWIFPSFSLSRDLHCWRASIQWQPQIRTFSFFIGVKAAPFSDFIKYQSGRNAFDNVGFGR